MLCFLNGVLLQQSEARIPISDRGFLYGDSLFETAAVHAGRVLFFEQHLDRLELGMQLLGFSERPTRTELASASQQVVSANTVLEGVLRLAVTRGSGARGANPAGAHSPTLLVTAAPLPPDLAQRAARGYRVITSQWRKPPSNVLPNQVKTGNYLNSILAMQQAAQCQADEALLLDQDGCIVECSQSSLFFVSGGAVLTSALSSGGLHSITREVVIGLAGQLGIQVQQGSIAAAMLAQAQEAFVTNSVIGIVPVAQIDASSYHVPGEVTAKLQQAWAQLLRKLC